MYLEARLKAAFGSTISAGCLADILYFLKGMPWNQAALHQRNEWTSEGAGLVAGGANELQTCYKKNGADEAGFCNCAKAVDPVAETNAWVTQGPNLCSGVPLRGCDVGTGFTVLDASWKPPAGILRGNLWFLGNYDQCLAVSVPKEGLLPSLS